jgi:hypothetical protein
MISSRKDLIIERQRRSRRGQWRYGESGPRQGPPIVGDSTQHEPKSHPTRALGSVDRRARPPPKLQNSTGVSIPHRGQKKPLEGAWVALDLWPLGGPGWLGTGSGLAYHGYRSFVRTIMRGRGRGWWVALGETHGSLRGKACRALRGPGFKFAACVC